MGHLRYAKFLMMQFMLFPAFMYCQMDKEYSWAKDWIWEIGMTVGVIQSLTDVARNKGKPGGPAGNADIKESHKCGGLFFSGFYRDRIGLRLAGMMGKVSGKDAVADGSAVISGGRRLRNLSFHSPVKELIFLLEIHPVGILLPQYWTKLSPYCLVGGGVFLYDPRTIFNGEEKRLRPLFTEGQGFRAYPGVKNYGRSSWNLPLGFGIRYGSGGRITWRFECIHRFTGTDYLDDVSGYYIDPDLFEKYLEKDMAKLARNLNDRSGEIDPNTGMQAGNRRGNPGKKDGYFTVGLKIGIILNAREN